MIIFLNATSSSETPILKFLIRRFFSVGISLVGLFPEIPTVFRIFPTQNKTSSHFQDYQRNILYFLILIVLLMIAYRIQPFFPFVGIIPLSFT